MLTLPDFNRLKVFHFVYKTGSIQKAAEEMHVTRSAISQAIKALEIELDCELFVRTNKTIIPTIQAERLSQTISPFIRELGETLIFF
ncbi:MAG: LysR family transcriptional regulator [Bdellovibrionota bacterium]